MEPLIGGPTSPLRLNTTPLHPDSQQQRELSEFSFYKAMNTGDCKALQSTYRRGKRSTEATKLKSLQNQDSFKRDALKTIFRFLTFSEFPGALSAKALSSPQRSLLIDIWSHLFRRCFDESVKITADNVNDEVPRLFKEIGYPFPISKSAMLAPGTAHQWPHHLAALSWLCELLIYENEFFYQEQETAELQGRGELVGRLVTSAYSQSNKDSNAVRNLVLGQLHAMNAEAEAAQQQVQQQLQQRQQQLAVVQAELRGNASLVESIEQLTRQEDATRASIAETKEEILHQESRAAAAAGERDLLQQQQKGLLDEVQQLEERVKAQGIDRAEVERIRHDVSRLREILAHRTKEINGLSEALQTLVDQVADESEKLRMASDSVNECVGSISQLALAVKLPTAEAWASLPKMETFAAETADSPAAAAAAANDVKSATNKILGVDWPALKKEMLRLIQLEGEVQAETHQQRQRAEREIEKLKRAIKDLVASRKTLEKRMQLVREDLQQQQQQHQAEQQQLEETERQQLEGIREVKQRYQQEQQQLQLKVQKQELLLQQEERQQQQEAASAMEMLQQQQHEALKQKRQMLQQLQQLAATKFAECSALEQQLLELTEALAPPPSSPKANKELQKS